LRKEEKKGKEKKFFTILRKKMTVRLMRKGNTITIRESYDNLLYKKRPYNPRKRDYTGPHGIYIPKKIYGGN
jgi:hypothetical protein